MNTTEELKKIITKIEDKKKIIAKERDELRDLYDEIVDVLESLNAGIEAVMPLIQYLNLYNRREQKWKNI